MIETEAPMPSEKQLDQQTPEEVDETTKDFDPEVVDKDVLVRRGDGQIQVWRLTGEKNAAGEYWAEGGEQEGVKEDGTPLFPGKYVSARNIGSERQGIRAQELAMNRPGLTPDQLERGSEQLREEVVADLGGEAVDTAGVDEPDPEASDTPGPVLDDIFHHRVVESAAGVIQLDSANEAQATKADVEVEQSDEAIKAEITMLTAEYKHRIARTMDQLAQDAQGGVRGVEGDIEEATGYLGALVRMVEEASSDLEKGWRQYDNGSYSEPTLAHMIEDARNSLHGALSRLAYANGFSSTVHTRLNNLAEAFNQGKVRLSTNEHDFDALMIGMNVTEKPSDTSTEQNQAEVDGWLNAVDEIAQSLPKGELVPDAVGNLRMVSNMLDEMTSQLRYGRFSRDQVIGDLRGAVKRLAGVVDSADMIRKRPILDTDALDKLQRSIKQMQ